MMPNADYARIERAIVFLRANKAQRPSLAETAAHVGLSPAHFQRLFTRWVGVSPKRFQQHETLDHAKSLLAEPRSLLDVTYEAGLTSPSRLHDLFVTLDGLTPGEWRAAGAGVIVRWGVHPSPFGDCLVATTLRGVCGLVFLDDAVHAASELARRWPLATVIEDMGATAPIAAHLESGPGNGEPLRLSPVGTNFQLAVWRALLSVPEGQVVTYEKIAEAVCTRRAVRAVGTAVGANPIAVLIPCHRVIRKNGALGGYRWGVPRKQALLAREAVRATEPQGPSRMVVE